MLRITRTRTLSPLSHRTLAGAAMRNLRSSAPFPLAVRPSGWHKSICTADPRRHETPNLDWNAEFRNAEFRFSQLLYQGQTLVVERKLFLKIYFWSILQKCSLCSMPTSAIRWMANIASAWTLPSSRRSDSPCLCVRVVRVRVCTSPVTLAHE